MLVKGRYSSPSILHVNLGKAERAGAKVDIRAADGNWGSQRLTRVASAADAIVLPGVGAFGDGIGALKGSDQLMDIVRGGEKCLLGICLGMQLLFDRGFEGGERRGLGLVRGEVVRLPPGMKIPHMGWNSVEKVKDSRLMAGIGSGEFFYFVHSYYCEAASEAVVAECQYGRRIPAVVEWRNIFGTQFHPEKSAAAGVSLLRNFLEAARG